MALSELELKKDLLLHVHKYALRDFPGCVVKDQNNSRHADASRRE